MRKLVARWMALMIVLTVMPALAQQEDGYELKGFVGFFRNRMAQAREQKVEKLFLEGKENPVLEVPLDAGSADRGDELVIRVEPTDLPTFDEKTFEDAEKLLASPEAVKPQQKKRIWAQLRQLLPFAKNANGPVPGLPENPELVEEIRGMKSWMLRRFFQVQQGGLRRIAIIAGIAGLPEDETRSLLENANMTMLRSARQIGGGGAWSMGFDILLSGGPAIGRLGQKLVLGTFGRLLGSESRATQFLQRGLEKGDSLYFQGNGGINFLSVPRENGKRRFFIQLTAGYDRSKTVLTLTSLLGFDTRAIMSTYEEGYVDSRTGKWSKPVMPTRTSNLGVAGMMTTSEGVSMFASQLPIPVIGGLALIPMIGNIQLYETEGRRTALVVFDLTSIYENAFTRSLGSAFRYGRAYLSGSRKSCHAVFAD